MDVPSLFLSILGKFLLLMFVGYDKSDENGNDDDECILLLLIYYLLDHNPFWGDSS